MQTYLFYDLETTGLHKCFDQILQFAAIRTDLQLNEIERHEFYIKLNPDVIPAPWAQITHQISLSEVGDGLCEYEAMQKIHALMNEPGTISLGYNTLVFDDEFLRFGFYRNLLTPYTHQYANRCYRMDIYPMIVMYYLFKPEVIQWPIKDGNPSLKLDRINELNHLAEGQAHNAMVDVEVTLALARVLRNEIAMWDYLSGYFEKKVDQDRALKLPTVSLGDGQICHQGLMVLSKLGSKYLYHAPVIGLGQHYHYKNQYLWLRLDQNSLKEATVDDFVGKTYCINKKLGELGFVLPLKEQYLVKMKDKRLEIMNENLKVLTENPALFEAIRDYYCDYKYPTVAGVDVDAALYQSAFWTPMEQKTLREFHQAKPSEKLKILNRLDNPDLVELGERLMAKNFPEYCPEGAKQAFDSHVAKVFSEDQGNYPLDFKGQAHFSMTDFTDQIAELEKVELDERQVQVLGELKSYLSQWKDS